MTGPYGPTAVCRTLQTEVTAGKEFCDPGGWRNTFLDTKNQGRKEGNDKIKPRIKSDKRFLKNQIGTK